VSAESKAPSHAPSPELDRAVAFAKAVLHRKLTSKEHAEECVRIARDAARRGKTLPIEEVFVRKGYLRRPEAQAVLKALDKEPKLELAENVGATPEKSSGRRAPRAKCPNCDKDPGHLPGECERCGTDLATGGPGPHATICTTCSAVVKRGAAVCPRCATPLARDHHRKFNRTKKDTAVVWFDRLILALALAGGVYFLALRKPAAPPPPSDDGNTGLPAPDAALAAAADAADKGDAAAAAKALEATIADANHAPEADVAFALACRKAGRTADARAAVARARKARPEDGDLLLLAAELELDAGDNEAAGKLLALVPGPKQQDGYWRAQARLADAKLDEVAALAALAKLQQRTPAEARRLAQAAVSRGNQAFDANLPNDAVKEFEAAVALAPDYAPARQRLGVALLKLGQTQLARQTFERAAELAPRDAAPVLGIALAADKLGDRPAAAKAYKKFIELGGKTDKFEAEIARVRKRLAEIAPGE